MYVTNSQSPNFQMKIKGLDDNYFKRVPPKMKQELMAKAEQAGGADFLVEFVPTKDNWIFLKKVKEGVGAIVDYFPSQYTPVEVVKTFTKAYIPEHRIMAKALRNDTNKIKAQQVFREHSDI